MGLYVVFDKVAQECSPVFEAKNDAVALRRFNAIVSDGVAMSDFSLIRVGYIDRVTCLLTPEAVPVDIPVMGVGSEVEVI